ncbi:DUF2267 domain-containing protein [Catalinimonas niigatensis]|uniref:DUF2267 domain-containing protein n=1 Tax=Catalinimonas niigatensis TaxID=1397264 RepID=UPI002665ACCC|nr:DUF2267 domain-containing protein [Catalinimonas niigatensis]WPP50805.1 DUF2267 domain-containing protein [Catalinimonas niigatensis]
MKTLHKLDKHVIYLDELILQVASLLDRPNDINCAARAVEAVLIAVRNRLTFEQSIKFLNYLPLPFKAIYIKDWKVNDRVPDRIESMNEFIEEVYRLDSTVCNNDYCEYQEIKKIVKAVFKVIGFHVSSEELKKELTFLPDDLRIYLEAEGVSIKSNMVDSSIWLS